MPLLATCLLIWMLVLGGLPASLVEELATTESSVGESLLLCRHDTPRAEPGATLRLFPRLRSARPPVGEPACQRTRIQALPIARRGPPLG